MVGHRIVGTGSQKVLVIHGWFSDSTTFDTVLDYVDTENYTYALMDLRGYGTSKNIEGVYTIAEATDDAIALTKKLGWECFHIIAHSMAGMIAQKIVVTAQDRVQSVVAITPVGANGSKVPDDMFAFFQDVAGPNDEAACQTIHTITQNRYTDAFARWKVAHWKTTSTTKARLGYLTMFCKTDFCDEVHGITTPYTVIVGKQDFESYGKEAMQKTFLTWYPNCTLFELDGCGHFPMQEVPPLVAKHITEHFERQKKALLEPSMTSK